MQKIICALFLVGILAAPLRSQEDESYRKTANWLVHTCTKPSADNDNVDFSYGVCFGYFEGLLVMNQLLQIGHHALFCPPDGVTVGELRLVFIKYMQDRPAALHENKHVMALKALNDAFPCKPE